MNLKILAFLVGILLIFLILYFSGITEVFQTIIHSNPIFILLALFGFSCSVFLKSLRWKILLKSIGFEVSYSQSFYSFNSAMFIGNLVPFKALEPIRGYLLKLKYNYSFAKTIPLVLTERALDVYVYIIFSLITLYVMRSYLSSSILLFSFIGMLSFAAIVTSILLILNSKKLTLKFFRFLSIMPVIKRFKKRIEGMAKNFSLGFNELKKSKFLAPVLLLTLLIWIIEGAIFLFSAKAVGMELSIGLFAIPLLSILLAFFTLIPGGLGSTEAIMVVLLSSLGFGTAQAASAVLIYRLFVHLIENSIGAVIAPQVYGTDIVKNVLKGKIF